MSFHLPHRLLVFAFTLWLTVTAGAFANGGQGGAYRVGEKHLELARDELLVTGPERVGRLEKVPGAKSVDDLLGAAARERAAGAVEAQLVFYPEGEDRAPENRHVLTRHLVVRLAPGADPAAVAEALSARYLPDRSARHRGRHVFELRDAAGAFDALARIRVDRRVVEALPQFGRLRVRYAAESTDPLFEKQWHLRNTEPGGIDINIGDLMDQYRGTGVIIGVIDDGVELAHPDLEENLVAGLHWDFRDDNADPSPELMTPGADDGANPPGEDRHGTSVAGVAAARGFNGHGGRGVAPEAGIAAIRLIGDYITDLQEAEAFLHAADAIAIKNNSWGPPPFGDVYSGPEALSLEALEYSVREGRGGHGGIFVFAAGNGRERRDNSNKNGYANSPYTIAVGAVNEWGRQTVYSESGANLVVCAPSSDRGARGIISTDLLGNDGYNNESFAHDLDDRDYTRQFGGTSAAAPIVAGVVALMLEANPGLGWRDVQEILMRTARRNDPDDESWFANAAPEPFHFSLKYGAGLVDATAAVNLAKGWTNLGPLQVTSFNASPPEPETIPDDPVDSLRRIVTVPVEANLRTEAVQLRLSILHARRGDLEIRLISPSGTGSVLLPASTEDGKANVLDWSYFSNHFRGEDAAGNWVVEIRDAAAGVSGELTQATLTVFGTSAAGAPAPVAPAGLTVQRITGASAQIDWESGDSTVAHRVERAADFGRPWIAVAEVAPGVSRYIDETLDPATRYFFRVQAVGSDRDSAYSEPVFAAMDFSHGRILYQSGFEAAEGYVAGEPLRGQNGWFGTGDATNRVTANIKPGFGQHARLGPVPDGQARNAVTREVLHFPADNADVRFAARVWIEPGNNPFDNFGFSFYDLTGAAVLSFDFDAYFETVSYWNGQFVETGESFSAGQGYDLELIFDFTANRFSAWLGSRRVIENAAINTISEPFGLGYVEAYWLIYPNGPTPTNSMLFDDLIVEEIASGPPDLPGGLEAMDLASTRIALVWEPAYMAESYRVERRSGVSAWQEVHSIPATEDSYFVVDTGLEPETLYEYRMRAHNRFGYSAYSETAETQTWAVYQDWLYRNKIPVDTEIAGDWNGDGVPLLLDYALDSNPNRPSIHSLPRAELQDNGAEGSPLLTLTYYRARDDVTYTVLRNTGLAAYAWTPDGVIQEFEVNGRFITAGWAVDGATSGFLKLQVTLD